MDKVVLVTGATSGIGKEIAAQLAVAGAEVVLACRDQPKAAIGEITRRAGAAARLSLLSVDTSSQASIRGAARRFKSARARLDVLVNGAGVNARTRRVSDDGIELTFATNVLGCHLLARELRDALRASCERMVAEA